MGRLAVWHMPDGQVGPSSMWAATSNAVSQTTYPVNSETGESEGKNRDRRERGTKSQRERKSGTREGAQGPLAQE